MTHAGDTEPADGRVRRGATSLSARFVGLILVFVISSGLALGVTVTFASLRNAVDERSRSLDYAARVIAASILPVVRDQDASQIQAGLTGILRSSELHEIECIELVDTSGAVIAESDPDCTCELVEPADGLLSIFTEPQVVEVPIEVDGLQVATVRIQFRAVGLEGAVLRPVAATFLSLGVVMVVSALWGGWAVMSAVVEPLEKIEEAASQIAHGHRDIELSEERSDEIGSLAQALNDMATQLQVQESEILGSYSQLETAFHDKADLARRLERTMRMKSDFVAMASHEIRSPLAVIQLYAEMLEDNEFGEFDPELAGAVGSIIDAVSRLNAIVSGLLDVALLQRGLMSLEYSEVSLDAIVEQAVADGSVLAEESRVKVVYRGHVTELVAIADGVRVRQVVDNLLSNAVKYSPEGSTVTVDLERVGDDGLITVTDEGPGISKEQADVLFQLFGRADIADNARVAGLGLGLAISDRIVKAHGGSITFEPGPDAGGTVFTVRLPLRADSASRRADSISVVDEQPPSEDV